MWNQPSINFPKVAVLKHSCTLNSSGELPKAQGSGCTPGQSNQKPGGGTQVSVFSRDTAKIENNIGDPNQETHKDILDKNTGLETEKNNQNLK